ncbi:unnamed protein product [Caenorhabditis angaria]|uniref:Glycosyltransferase family 92 protein n=1 Tax=Caenorhabditis angaria TaxID=860376 RepID=A0A9P1IH33_9PELO|nr:unnamed protein product [Caenorhabditis angaria]
MRRKKSSYLIFIAVFLVFFYFFGSIQDFELEDQENNYEDNFDPIEDEIFVKNYLELMQKNRAPARPVIEKEQKIIENRWCFLAAPKIMKNPRENWLKVAGIEIFSAYYDDRPNSLFPDNSAIQVLVMSNHTIESKIDIYCNIFVKNSRFQKYTVVQGYIREIWQRGWDPRGNFQVPSLISCPIPEKLDFFKNSESDVEYSVSLTRSNCKSQKIAMKVVGKSRKIGEKKKDVAICLKGLDYQEDISGRLLEWLELQYILGADTIGVYMYFLTQKTQNVLKYYEKLGKLTLDQISLSGSDPNSNLERSQFLKNNRPQKRRHELIPYNDCFYRHIHTHNYVLILDIDEVVVPIGNFSSYSEMLRSVEKRLSGRSISSLSARNVFKFQTNFEVGKEWSYMRRNRKRSKNISKMGEFGKSFSSTKSVATVFNHFALHKLSYSSSKSVYLSPNSEAIKLHYKSECPQESRNECQDLQFNLVDDTSLDRFEKQLEKRVELIRKLIL